MTWAKIYHQWIWYGVRYSLWCHIYWWYEHNRLRVERMPCDVLQVLAMESDQSLHRYQCALLATNSDPSRLWSVSEWEEFVFNMSFTQTWTFGRVSYLQDISVGEFQSDFLAWQQRIFFWFIFEESPHITLKWMKNNIFEIFVSAKFSSLTMEIDTNGIICVLCIREKVNSASHLA